MDTVLLIVTFKVASEVATGEVDVSVTEIEVFVSRTEGDILVKFVLLK